MHGSRWIITMHLHTGVGWCSLFIDPATMFEGAVEGSGGGIRIPRREAAMAITSAHALYEDETVRLIELYKVRHLMRSGHVDWDWLWDCASRGGFDAGLALAFLIMDTQHQRLMGKPLFEESVARRIEGNLSWLDGTRQHYQRHVRGKSLPSYYSMSKYFARRCLFRQIWRSRLATAWQKAKMTAWVLWDGFLQVFFWRPQPPALVAICGPDGCGKTTQVERLAAVLKVFEIRSRRCWIRIGDSPLLNVLKRPFQGKVRAEVDDGQSSEQGVFRSRLARSLWPVVALADYIFRQNAAFAWNRLRGRMVIADRYHVDALVDLALRCGPEVMRKRWVLWALRLLPQPRAAFVLKVSDETMLRRRREDYVQGVSHRVSGYYDEAARAMGAGVLCGERDPEEIIEVIAKEVLANFLEPLRQ